MLVCLIVFLFNSYVTTKIMQMKKKLCFLVYLHFSITYGYKNCLFLISLPLGLFDCLPELFEILLSPSLSHQSYARMFSVLVLLCMVMSILAERKAPSSARYSATRIPPCPAAAVTEWKLLLLQSVLLLQLMGLARW